MAVVADRPDKDGMEYRATLGGSGNWYAHDRSRGWISGATPLRPLVVIDPEDREQVERLAKAWHIQPGNLPWDECDDDDRADSIDTLIDALREFANPTPPKPEEPTDPKACVTDRRENVWRLLADGDWICTSGPDIGEYLNWDQLAGDRGPVEVSR